MKLYIWIHGISILAMTLGLTETSAATPRVVDHDLSATVQAKVQAAYGQLDLDLRSQSRPGRQEGEVPFARQQS